MPRFDGTGPSGDGRPGRGLGPCGRSVTKGTNNRSQGSSVIDVILDILRSILNKNTNTKRR